MAEKLHKKLLKQAAKKKLDKENRNKYVYSTINKYKKLKTKGE